MNEKLNKLRQYLRPTTVAEARAAMERYEAEQPNDPAFVPALESEMREEFLAGAHVLQRQEAQLHSRRSMEMS